MELSPLNVALVSSIRFRRHICRGAAVSKACILVNNFGRPIWAFTVMLLTSLPNLSASEVIRVELDDHRTLFGHVDARTNEETLWLCSLSPGIVLRSGFDWNEVVRVHFAAGTLSSAEFRRVAPSLALDPEHVDHAAFSAKDPSDERLPPELTAGNDSWPQDALSTTQRFPTLPVASLSIEAGVANWDDDVEPDGLRVFVSPLDREGNIVPINGTLDFTLVGQSVNTPYNRRRVGRSGLFPELGRWSRRVRKSDFDRSVAVYELPFRQINPEFDLAIAPYGLLNARLGVAGLGRFDASDDNVDLRPLSRIRDEFELFGARRRSLPGRRFIPLEHTRRHGWSR